jgi:hypothetical protein
VARGGEVGEGEKEPEPTAEDLLAELEAEADEEEAGGG